ncbi:16S rRNA (guanine1207-N2)-methyltransferase [Rheinheimera pacifica]|uniref:Ribosomal RNA large subunit methyltransferase G n=1 Tax=Rheinheimera pacifica TaxID=173990 RepID=A0A1H6M470_9GAMM|nr:methyltransferase [Rheinheimera pacifica]SEH92743.1 16S rRNA (guanine1207-N2)-methyltransferase [Rheinheimera pacifica]
MNTTFVHSQGSLQLHRWPLNQPNNSLQAWDAADELLILHAQEAISQFTLQHQRQPTLLLINDSFGALSSALSGCTQFQINDSVLAAKGTLYNRQQNNIADSGLQQLSSLAPYPAQPDIVLLKLPNNHSYLQYILQQLARVVTPQSIILASAKAKDISRNVLAMFDNTLGPATASLTVKKCRLIECSFSAPLPGAAAVEFPLAWPLEQTEFTVINHANVFSREKLDQGARFFLQHLPEIKSAQRVIDLGCGNGVLGLALLTQHNDFQLLCCDESYMAADSAQQTIANNLPDKLAQCEFIVDDCLSQQADKSADVVLCNPPFHQQHAVTGHIANQMFTDAKRVLKQGGRLRIVANRHLGYADVLKRLFGNCHQLAADPKFVILEAIKRS